MTTNLMIFGGVTGARVVVMRSIFWWYGGGGWWNCFCEDALRINFYVGAILQFEFELCLDQA